MGPKSIPSPEDVNVKFNGLTGPIDQSQLEVGDKKATENIADIARLINEGIIPNID